MNYWNSQVRPYATIPQDTQDQNMFQMTHFKNIYSKGII